MNGVSMAALLGRGPIALVLLAAIVPRLAHVWAPIVGWHAWRQADTAAIARNFHRDGMNLLYPAVDWAGAGPGYVESEFPLFPYAVAGLYQLFGVQVVWGRILAILFSVAASLYLYRLCARYVDRWTAAFSAAAFSLFPINTYIGVAFMPEPLMLFASVAAIDHMDRWSRSGREHDRWLSALFLATAIAVKVPELFLGLPIAYLFWRRLGWRMFMQPGVWLYAATVLGLPALWYVHAHSLGQMTGLTFGIWDAGSGKWGNLDLLISPTFYSKLLFSRIIERHLVYAGFLLFVMGWVVLRRRRDLGTFKWWGAGAALYLLVAAKGNQVHDYYQLPVLLPLALWVGAGIAWALAPRRTTLARIAGGALVATFLALSLLRTQHFLEKEISSTYLLDFADMVQGVVSPEARVIAVDGSDPTMLYHADRKGWHAHAESITEDWVDARRLEGAAYLVALAESFERPDAIPNLEMLQRRYANRSTRSGFYIFDLASALDEGDARERVTIARDNPESFRGWQTTREAVE